MTKTLPDFLLELCQLILVHKVHFVNDDQVRQSNLPATQEYDQLLATNTSSIVASRNKMQWQTVPHYSGATT
jgi:hypothetical protein